MITFAASLIILGFYSQPTFATEPAIGEYVDWYSQLDDCKDGRNECTGETKKQAEKDYEGRAYVVSIFKSRFQNDVIDEDSLKDACNKVEKSIKQEYKLFPEKKLFFDKTNWHHYYGYRSISDSLCAKQRENSVNNVTDKALDDQSEKAAAMMRMSDNYLAREICKSIKSASLNPERPQGFDGTPPPKFTQIEMDLVDAPEFNEALLKSSGGETPVKGAKETQRSKKVLPPDSKSAKTGTKGTGKSGK